MYAMDMRQYDPAIARWVVQDPVVHFDYSPYNAFDNNPVFWADPSGADSETDYLGRNKYDRHGLYITPNDRGQMNFSHGMSDKSNEEPPINGFGNVAKDSPFRVPTNFKYTEGDGVFNIFAHANSDGLEFWDKNGKKH